MGEAGLADPFSADSLIFPWKDSGPDRLREWRSRVRPPLKRDSIVPAGEGKVRVRLTVVSLARGWESAWIPMTYAFSFSADGQLLAWDRHVRDALPDSLSP